MNPGAITKAYKRLKKAEQCLEGLRQAPNPEAFEAYWTDFLIALNGVTAVLEQGAKSNPQSRQWYGHKKSIRRQDELLRYLHQARNADEHGIREIVRKKDAHLEIDIQSSAPVDTFNINYYGIEFNIISDTAKGSNLISIDLTEVILVDVVDDRFGIQIFQVPTSHLGRSLDSVTPAKAARLGLDYYRDLLQEAERLLP